MLKDGKEQIIGAIKMETANIKKELIKIEKEKNICILFAVETGSRVWRMESSNSDYDIRFVYMRLDAKDYLRLGKLPDVIDTTIEDADILGFDIFKFCKLLLNSNPSVIEWLESDIIYVDDNETKEKLRKFINKKFNPIALYHHYKSMCKQNYLKYLKTSVCMTHKKYLYCMRGLVNAKYVLLHDQVPPITFEDSLKLTYLGNQDVKKKILEVIELKKTGFEEVRVSKIHLFEKYIEGFLETEEQPESRRIIDYKEVQEYIWKLILDCEDM